MTDILRTLLGVSVTGGIFILAAVLIRAGMKNRMPKHFLVLLWAAVLLHLLLLARVPSPTSIYNYIAFQRPAALDEALYPDPVRGPESGVAVVESQPPAEATERDAPFASAGGRLSTVLLAVWLGGVGMLGIGFAFCYWMTRRRFADAILVKHHPTVDRWLARRPRSGKVYVSDKTPTPLSCGFFRPRIILPLDFETESEARLESVLEHEYVHGANYHNVMKFLVGIAVVLHWFNPLVWLFWLLFNHDLELACDEQVLRRIGPARRAEYAHSLVAVAERVMTPLPLVSAFNARNLRERIVDVMGFKRVSAYWVIPELLLVAAMFALFGTDAATSGSPAPFASISPAPSVPSIAPPPLEAEPVVPAELPSREDEIVPPPEFAEWRYPEDQDPLTAALSLTGGGTVVKSEVDAKHGKRVAEFKILSDRHEYIIKLDTRRRTMVKYERKEMKKKPHAPPPASGLISMERARELAVRAVGGGEVVEVELKRKKSGAFQYEVKVLGGGREYEVELDAASGRILDIDD